MRTRDDRRRNEPDPLRRAEYGAEQAALLRSLMTEAPVPAGFDGERALVVRESLRRKRARAVARAWPALAHGLGRRFGVHFAAYAERSPPIGDLDAVADGLGFHDWLRIRTTLDDRARQELLRTRAQYVPRGNRTRRRRTPWAGVTRTQASRFRFAFAVFAPGLGATTFVLPRMGGVKR